MEDKKSRAILGKIQDIARQPGFIYILALLVRRDMFFGRDEAADIDWSERLHNHELDLLTGFVVKDTLDLRQFPDQASVEAIITELRGLFNDLHMHLAGKFFEDIPSTPEAIAVLTDAEKDELTRKIFGRGEIMAEPIFYGNSGAYDFQYLWLVEDLYALDKEWLERNGVDLELYAKYCFGLKAFIMEKSNKIDADTATPVQALDGLSFNAEELLKFIKSKSKDERYSKESLQKFLDSFKITPSSTTNKSFDVPGDRNAVEPFPIISLDDNKYFVPSEFNLAESIYNIPWIWMMHDKTYKAEAEKHRGDNIELLAKKLLDRTFGGNTYHAVKIKKGSSEITDVDVLVLVGNKAIVFQCKSKWLTDLSKKGNDSSLEKDFHDAIQSAYNQGITSRAVLLKQSGYDFELADGTKVKPSEKIDEVYLVCVTASVYPAAINQVESYLKKDKKDPATIAISLLDLDLLTYYLRDPHEFLFYVKQRIELYESFKGTSEISLLGYHLSQRIHKLPPGNITMADETFGQLIDADLMHRVGFADEPKEKDKLSPSSPNQFFERMLDEIKQIQQPEVTDAIMFLMSMSGNTIDELTGYIQDFITKVSSGEREAEDFSMTLDLGLGGFTYVCGTDSNKVMQMMELLAAKNKYKYKANQWLVLGTVVDGSSRIVSVLAYNKAPWKYSADTERRVKLFDRHAKRGQQADRHKNHILNKRPKRKKKPKTNHKNKKRK